MNLTSDDAASVSIWALESLARTLEVEIDPLELRRQGRAALDARTPSSETQLARALMRVGEGLKLDLRPTLVDETALATAPLPLLTCGGGGALISERRGQQLLVTRPGEEPRWLSADELIEAVGEPRLWLTGTPAAPLADLHGHHTATATPGQRLLALLRLERDDLLLIVTYAVVVGLLTLAVPIAVQALVTTVAFGTLLQPIVILAVMLLAALAFQGTLRALQLRVVESIQRRVFVRTAVDLAWRLPRVKREVAGPDYGPEKVNRFFDVLTVQKAASVLLTDGIATALQIGIGLLVLAFYHPALLAFDLVLLGLLAAVVLLPLQRGVATSLKESKAKYAVAGWLEALARRGSALRSEGGATFAAERADALTGRYLEARHKHFKVVFGQAVGGLALQVFASVALLGLGGALVVQQSLTLGQLIAAELIVAAVASSIAKTGKLLDASYDLLAALDKLGQLVDLPVEDPAHGEPVPGQGGVRVEVHAASDGEALPVDLEVKAGERLALAGAEGHPLGEWLTALRVPAHGAVTFNSVESSRARTPALRDRLAFVQRDDFFEGSLLENLTLGRLGVTPADARSALEEVGLLGAIRALPEGLDTHLSHTGAPLTHTQLAQLLVARAIAASPRLIVVDGSLESIEPLARARCVAALTRPDAPWTLVALVPDENVDLARACARAVHLNQLSRAPSEVA